MVRYSGVVMPKMSTAAKSRSWTMPVKRTPTRSSLDILTIFVVLNSVDRLSKVYLSNMNHICLILR